MGLRSILAAAGRVTGVLGSNDAGEPVAGRRARLVASAAALIGALMIWGGIPQPVAQAAAEFIEVLASP